MSMKIVCNGCGDDLRHQVDVAVQGERAGSLGGGGLPNGEFHLCYPCAVVAFHAVVTRPSGVVDTHKLAGEIQDARAGRRG